MACDQMDRGSRAATSCGLSQTWPIPDPAHRYLESSDHLAAIRAASDEFGTAHRLECAKVDPSSACQHIVRGETENEVLQSAGERAKEHGILEITPELMERVKANIRDT